ncbi:MAG: hypothetical protein ACWA41_07080 [Putridiphycobacter sp.]
MRIGLILVLFFGFVGCKKDNSQKINFGYQYFPFTEGKYSVYDVMSIVHDDPISVHDTTYLQIKEVIGESYTDEEGETARKLYRYKRYSSTDNWQIKDVWSVKLTPQTAEVVEENQRIIKMAFAISYEQTWDANALNNKTAENCFYTHITEPFTVDNQEIYDSTAIVEHINNLNYIEYQRHFEVYAANYGKIYSVNKDLSINNGDTLDVEKGFEIYYSIVEAGEE